MNLSQRIQTALREDGNIVALAGSAALSLALLNPIPLLIGMVAETVYLLYVPDSRWYANRLSARYDNEVKNRRAGLRDETAAFVPPETLQAWLAQETLRQSIGERARDVPEWQIFLRRLDYLLELQIKTAGVAARVHAKIRQYAWANAEDADPVSAGTTRIAYYESTVTALQNVASNASGDPSKAGIQGNIKHVEEQKTNTQKELFQVIAAQHLTDSTKQSMIETLRFLKTVRDAKEEHYQSWWGEDALRITKSVETNLHRLDDWMKQTRA
ncbi:MAG: hypothetical protein H7Y38_11385 [Armatimonadetes bacterium]|nr:hypothetical protein [Armatimonadota bacterium]